MSLFVGALLVPAGLWSDTISNNLAASSGGIESATSSDWLAASFTTISAATLQDAVLLLADTTASGASASVSIYSDDGLNEPGSLLALLSSNATLSTSLASSTWASTGFSLSANSTYWIVLRALTGQVDWSYAANDSGVGTGFTDAWAASYDAGSSWYTYASLQDVGIDPLQMDIETDLVSTAAIPEPASSVLLIAGTVAVVAHRKRANCSKRIGG